MDAMTPNMWPKEPPATELLSHFIRRHAASCDQEFERELHYLIRAVTQEAQARILKSYTDLISVIAPPPIQLPVSGGVPQETACSECGMKGIYHHYHRADCSVIGGPGIRSADARLTIQDWCLELEQLLKKAPRDVFTADCIWLTGCRATFESLEQVGGTPTPQGESNGSD